MNRERSDVLILGAGLAGLACARELAGAGLSVTVLERREGSGLEASGAGAGMLSPLVETREEGVHAPLFQACREARDLWPHWAEELRDETSLPVDHDSSGTLVVALDDASERELDRLAERARQRGEPCEEVGVAAALRLLPDLSRAVRRTLLLPGEHRANNVQAIAALERSCQRRGVDVRFGVVVERVEVETDRVGVVTRGGAFEGAIAVVALGAWSGRLEGLSPLPVRPVRGQMMRMGNVDWPWQGTLRIAGGGYAVRRGNGLLIGATSEEVGFENEVNASGLAWLTELRRRLFPSLAEAPIEAHWSGLRPASADGLPILGRWSGDAFAATGLYRHGILLAPWVGREVAQAAIGGENDLAAFSPDRFEHTSRE